MFTGIIESTGEIKQIIVSGNNRIFWIASPLSSELKIDQSLSHDGVCLTVDALKEGMHRVTAVEETLGKTNLKQWKTGAVINLERSLLMNGRIDGHLVQGHVDTTAICMGRYESEGSWEFQFGFPGKFSGLVIEKGSVAINGISLTVFDVKKRRFKVAIIPYTFGHTNIKGLSVGEKVNLEFDVIGKYIQKNFSLKK